MSGRDGGADALHLDGSGVENSDVHRGHGQCTLSGGPPRFLPHFVFVLQHGSLVALLTSLMNSSDSEPVKKILFFPYSGFPGVLWWIQGLFLGNMD